MKQLLCLLSAILYLFCVSPQCFGEEAAGTVGKVTTNNGPLKIREKPSRQGRVLAEIPDETYILVLSEADGWVEAVYRGQTGYCKADFITVQKEADPALLTYRVIRKGDRGEEVLAIKQRLQELGYIRQSSKLTEDYNDTTVQRVKLFQKQMGMKEDGIASPEVQACLFSDRALSCTQSLPKARSRVASGSDDSKREICGCCMGEGCECCGFRGWVYGF